MQSVLSAITPSNILDSVKKLTTSEKGYGGSMPPPAPTSATTKTTGVFSPVQPMSTQVIPTSAARAEISIATERVNQILAETSDDEDLAISAALSRAANLVEEVRGGSGMSK